MLTNATWNQLKVQYFTLWAWKNKSVILNILIMQKSEKEFNNVNNNGGKKFIWWSFRRNFLRPIP